MGSRSSGSDSDLRSVAGLSQLSAPAIALPALSAIGPLAITPPASLPALAAIEPLVITYSSALIDDVVAPVPNAEPGPAGVMSLLDMLEQRETSKRRKKTQAFRNHECDNLMCWINFW